MTSDAFRPGDLLDGRYRLERVLGSGSIGTVWKARNESIERDFAIKLMSLEAAKDAIAFQRFFNEAKAAGKLRHSRIVEVYDLKQLPRDKPGGASIPYIVMELLDGESLATVLERGRLSIGVALRLLLEVARGIDAAHKAGIVHRDIKPANVHLHRTKEGEVVPKVLDFGISKLMDSSFDAMLTETGMVIGSPGYLSPEQAKGSTDIDGKTDVWALGVLLYQSLSGALPYEGANNNALVRAIENDPPIPVGTHVSDLPTFVSTIVERCLARSPAERYTVDELVAALERALSPIPYEQSSLDQLLTDPRPGVESAAAPAPLGAVRSAPRRTYVIARLPRALAIARLPRALLIAGALSVLGLASMVIVVRARSTYSEPLESDPAPSLTATPRPIDPTAAATVAASVDDGASPVQQPNLSKIKPHLPHKPSPSEQSRSPAKPRGPLRNAGF